MAEKGSERPPIWILLAFRLQLLDIKRQYSSTCALTSFVFLNVLNEVNAAIATLHGAYLTA